MNAHRSVSGRWCSTAVLIAFATMLVVCILPVCTAAEADWDSWSGNRSVYINNMGGSALTDYQINVSLSPGINATSLRVVNKTSGAAVPHWGETVVGGDVTELWFKAPHIPADKWCNDTYAIYYGNNTASSTSDYDNTFTKTYNNTGLVLELHMDEGTQYTTATDSSGEDNDGVLKNMNTTGNATSGWQNVDGGQWGGRDDMVFADDDQLRFDGVNDYVDCGNDPSLDFGTDSFSTSFWFKSQSKVWGRVIGQEGDLDHWWSCFDGGTNHKMRWKLQGNASTSKAVTQPEEVFDDKWHHAVWIVDRTQHKVIWYFDGVKSTTETDISLFAGLDFDSASPVLIGKSHTTNYLNGSIDEVRIYNRSLSEDEIYRQYIRSKYTADAPTAVLGTATQVVMTPATDDSTVAGQNITFTATLQDVNGNQVDFTDTTDVVFSGGDGSWGDNALARGRITNNYTTSSTVVTDEVLTVTEFIDIPTGDQTDTSTITTGAAATQVVVSNPTDGTVDADISVTIQIQDQYGNVVGDAAEAVTVTTDGSAVISGVTTGTGDATYDSNSETVTSASGVIVVTVHDETAETVNINVEHVTLAHTSTQNVVFDNGAATQVVVSNPTDGTVDADISVTIQIQDQYGNVVGDAAEAVTVTTDGSAVISGVTTGTGDATYDSNSETVTSASGVIVVTVHDETAETVNINVEHVTLAHTSTQNVVFGPGTAATQVVVSNPTDGTVDADISVTIQIQDQYGNVVGDAAEAVTVTTDGSAVISGVTTGTGDATYDSNSETVTSASGVIVVTVHDETAETVNINVEHVTLADTSTENVVFDNGAATQVVVSNPTDGTVDADISVTIQIQDQYGNVVGDAAEAVTVTTDGSAVISGVTTGTGDATYDSNSETVTSASGVIVVTVHDETAETVNINVEHVTLADTSTENVVFDNGAATQVVVSNPTDGTVDADISVTIQIQDQYGNVVGDAAEAVTVTTDGSAVISGVTTGTGDGAYDSNSEVVTSDSGVIVVTVHDETAETVNINVEHVTLAHTSTQNVVFDNGAATQVVVSNPTDGTVDADISVTIQIQDQYGNVVGDAAEAVTVTTDGSAVISGVTTGTGDATYDSNSETVTSASGVIVVTVHDETAETVNINVEHVTLAHTSTQNVVFGPGTAATQVVVSNPTDGTVDADISVTIQIQDQYGNVVGDAAEAVTVTTDGSAVISGVTTGTGDATYDSNSETVTSASGVIVVTVHDETAETVNINVEHVTLADTSTENVVFDNGAATQVVVSNPTDGTVDADISVTIQIQDQYGNVVGDAAEAVTVTTDGSAVISGVTTGTGDATYDSNSETVTSASGVIVVTVHDETAETVNINVEHVTLADTSTENVVFDNGAATQVVVSNPTDGTVDADISVTIQIQDQYGNVVGDAAEAVTVTTDGSAVISGVTTGTGDGAYDSNSEVVTSDSGVIVVTVHDETAETVNINVEHVTLADTSTQNVVFGSKATPSGSGGDICVNTSGWWRGGGAFNESGTPIQAAVGNASRGETIFVWNGSYSENVLVNERLTLAGEGADVVNVTAPEPGDDHVFNVTADYVNISGFNVSGAISYDKAGIYLNSSQHCNISNNIASGNDYGIALAYSSNNTLTSNTASSNEVGIGLDGSSNNTLTSNTASDNWAGIWLGAGMKMAEGVGNNTTSDNFGRRSPVSSNDTLTDNGAPGKGYGIMLDAGVEMAEGANNNTLTSNTASSNEVGIGLVYSSNNTLTSNTASSNEVGIGLVYSSNNTLTSNTASGNEVGIGLDGSSNNTLTSNNASGNGCGIWLVDSSNDNTLTSNNASNNWVGIYIIEESNNNTLTSNTASDNSDWDIYIYNSPSNTFTDNTLNGTTVSFTYSGDVSLRGVGLPAAGASGWYSIGKFINATNQSAGARLYLNFSYSGADVSGLDESSLKVWKYNGTTWLEDGWNGTRYLSTANNVVGVNITTFSVFAPMALAASGAGSSSGGSGTYPPGWFGTPTPTVTATKAPATATATAAPPDDKVTPAPTKKPAVTKATTPTAEGTTAETAKKDAPGFTAVFAIAGMLAVAYAMMRRRE